MPLLAPLPDSRLLPPAKYKTKSMVQYTHRHLYFLQRLSTYFLHRFSSWIISFESNNCENGLYLFCCGWSAKKKIIAFNDLWVQQQRWRKGHLQKGILLKSFQQDMFTSPLKPLAVFVFAVEAGCLHGRILRIKNWEKAEVESEGTQFRGNICFWLLFFGLLMGHF